MQVFSKEDGEQEACQSHRFFRCRGHNETGIIFLLPHVLPGMACSLQHLGISLGGSHVDMVSLILRLYAPRISCQPCGYASAIRAQMVSNLHP